MIELKKIPQVKENIDFLKSQLELFKNKIGADIKILVTQKNTPTEVKSRIYAVIDSHKEKLSTISQHVENIRSIDDLKNIEMADRVARLKQIDEILYKVKEDIQIIVKEQFNCNLDNYRRELDRATSAVLEMFDFLIPNIKNEIAYLRRFYRIPSNAANTIIPELEELIQNLESHKITLTDFIYGYKEGKNTVEGYDSLRSKNNVFSRFQYYENSPETYDEINGCIYEVCKAIWPFLKEQKTEPEFSKLFSQIEEINRKAANPKYGINISSMKDLFEFNYIFRSLVLKVGKKYSYRDEYKKTKSKVNGFNELQKSIITYHQEEFSNQVKKIDKFFTNEKDNIKFKKIISEVRRYLEEKTLPFERIELVFQKLVKKDFNIVVLEKEADDLTIKVTPHLAEKFGENNLKTINIIIQEIDFWFPYESKQWMFEELSKITQKIQVDEPVEKKEFKTILGDFNKEIDIKYRKLYLDQIKLLNDIIENFANLFEYKRDQDKLNKRLADKEAWKEVSIRLLRVKRNLAVLASNHSSLSSNINKFPFLKNAMEDLCQLLYDYSMQLFILYEMADQRSIINMTNILSTFNEFHDAKSLNQVFYTYFNQSVISNFFANETRIIRLTQNFLCKTNLEKLFPKKK